MGLPTLAIVNFTTTLQDNDVLEAIHAVNRQITENFIPIWGYGRTLEPLVPNFDPADPDQLAQERVPADSVIYLVDESSVPGALGFHDLNARDLPFGFVFVLDPDDWTTTLSHEVLELVLDPTANVLVPGPDPRNPQNTVLHAYEACDAVERLSYSIGSIDVSDFVTPSYFTLGEAADSKNDFLGVGVPSFGATRDSHIAFLDLATGQFETVFGQHAPAQRRMASKVKAHDHPKPKRPSDETLGRLLSARVPTARGVGAEGVPVIRGITRTSRYREAATRVAGMMHAPQG
jgi:hypothetical protein